MGGGGRGGPPAKPKTRMLRPISLHEVHVCPTVEEEDGELVYRVTGC